MDPSRRRRPRRTDRATLAGTGLAVVAAPALALAADVVETLFAPAAMAGVAAVALTLASVTLARGRDPFAALADARIPLAAALLVDAALVARLLGGAGAGLGAVYAVGTAALRAAVDGRPAVAASVALDAGFLPFCVALGVALVAVHDAARARTAVRGRTRRSGPRRGGPCERVDERER